ncbi:MAG: hypothetical protein IT371_29440 [Deltaproteobacteria bacterium]|nr:hypothetical protein [Deltaproteobacteria bacterium]
MRALLVALAAAIALVGVGRAEAGNRLELSFDPSLPTSCVEYLNTALAAIYPEVVRVYGEPAKTHTVLIRHDPTYYGGMYNPVTGQLVLGWLPSCRDAVPAPTPAFDQFLTHELIHAFHGGYVFTASWAEEGMTSAGVELVRERLLQTGTRTLDASFDWKDAVLWYDTFANLGARAYGHLMVNRSYADWISGPTAYAGLFSLLALSQHAGPAGQWESADALGKVNRALYTRPQGLVEPTTLVQAVGEALVAPVDGVPPSVWIPAQPVAAGTTTQGRFLGVYGRRGADWPASPVSPTWVVFFAFAWGRDPQYPALPAQVRIESGELVTLRVTDVDGKERFRSEGSLATAKPSYPGGNAVPLTETMSWPFGAYQLDAEVTVGGERLRARNYFLAGVKPLGTAADGLAVLAVDEAGQLVGSGWSSIDCQVSRMERGATLLTVPATASRPARCTLRSLEEPTITHVVTVPEPGTRVVTRVAVRGVSRSDGGVSDGGRDAGVWARDAARGDDGASDAGGRPASSAGCGCATWTGEVQGWASAWSGVTLLAAVRRRRRFRRRDV